MKIFSQKILVGIIVVAVTLVLMICIPQNVLAAEAITSVNVESAQVTINQNTNISVQS